MSWALLGLGLFFIAAALVRLGRSKGRQGQYRLYKSQIGGWNRLFGGGPPSDLESKLVVIITNAGMGVAGLVLALMGLGGLR